jgi:hypothetical protein
MTVNVMGELTALVEGVPDGLMLSEWCEQNDVGRTTSYALLKILKAMGIEPKAVRKKGATKPSPLLDGDALDAINHLLAQHRDGRSIAQLEAEHTSAIVAASTQPTIAAPLEDDSSFNPSSLLNRLQAASLAQTTGIPLTKAEVEWLLGSGLNTEAVKHARCSVEKLGTKWSLKPPLG